MTVSHTPPTHEVRADFDDQALTVYQAYSPEIADRALAAGTFVAPFKRDRMTWIKPSFLWMMYRCGWATKPNQDRVLAVRISRAGFEWALAHSCLSRFDPEVYASHAEWLDRKNDSPVRVQWDPERSLQLEPLNHRAIQVGLSGQAMCKYLDEWIISIHDVTSLAIELHEMVSADMNAARHRLPIERRYELPEQIRRHIGAL